MFLFLLVWGFLEFSEIVAPYRLNSQIDCHNVPDVKSLDKGGDGGYDNQNSGFLSLLLVKF